MPLPVFRNETDATTHRVPDARDACPDSTHRDRTAHLGVEAKKSVGDLRPPRADKPSKADLFPGMHGERNVLELSGRGQIIGTQPLLATIASSVLGEILLEP